MTLIATVVSPYGIIHASDSNLTGASSVSAGSGKKVFCLGFADAALAVAGAYTVGGQRMDTWMQATIDAYLATGEPTLAGFANYLADRLTNEINDRERRGGSLIHIAGYVHQDGTSHPEFFFVRNIKEIDQTGAYVGRSQKFLVSEDFWTRDYLKPDVKQSLALGGYMSYFNGYTDGRIAYLGLRNWLGHFFNQVWTNKDWKFRRTGSLDELAPFVALEIRAVCTMFLSSDYPAAYIGGEVQIESIAPPSNAVSL